MFVLQLHWKSKKKTKEHFHTPVFKNHNEKELGTDFCKTLQGPLFAKGWGINAFMKKGKSKQQRKHGKELYGRNIFWGLLINPMNDCCL